MSEMEEKEEPATPAETEETKSETDVITPAETTLEETKEEPVKTVSAAEEKEEEGEETEEEIEVVEEKNYTISLRHVWVVTPRGRRAPRAVRDVRDYVSRHMKAEDVSISNDVNAAIWSRSINKPPRKITVRAVKDKEGKVIVYLPKTA
jgi:large subunit ribosomal protein L31e